MVRPGRPGTAAMTSLFLPPTQASRRTATELVRDIAVLEQESHRHKYILGAIRKSMKVKQSRPYNSRVDPISEHNFKDGIAAGQPISKCDWQC